MSFISVLSKIDSAIDKGIAYADNKTAFIDKAEVFVCRGKTADERLDQGVAAVGKGIKDVCPRIKEDISSGAQGIRETIQGALNKAKGKVMPLINKGKERLPNLPKINLPKVAKVKVEEPDLDIPIYVSRAELAEFIPMAKVVDTSHKTPKMDLRSDKQVEVPVLAQMNAFVQNAMDNTPFAEMSL